MSYVPICVKCRNVKLPICGHICFQAACYIFAPEHLGESWRESCKQNYELWAKLFPERLALVKEYMETKKEVEKLLRDLKKC